MFLYQQIKKKSQSNIHATLFLRLYRRQVVEGVTECTLDQGELPKGELPASGTVLRIMLYNVHICTIISRRLSFQAGSFSYCLQHILIPILPYILMVFIMLFDLKVTGHSKKNCRDSSISTILFRYKTYTSKGPSIRLFIFKISQFVPFFAYFLQILRIFNQKWDKL